MRLEILGDKREIKDVFDFQVVMLDKNNNRKSLDTFNVERVFFISGYKCYELDIKNIKPDHDNRSYFSSVNLKKLGFKKNYPIKMLLQVKKAGFIRSNEYSQYIKMK